MPFWDRRTARVIVTVLLFVAALALVWLARRTLLAFVFAVFFAYMLEPVVEQLQQRTGWSRVRSVAVTYISLLAVLVVLSLLMVPAIVDEGQRAVRVLPGVIQQIGSGKIVWQLGGQHGWSVATEAELERLIASHRSDVTAAVQSAGAHAAEVGTNIGWLLLVPILAIFFLKDKAAFGGAVLDLVEPHRRAFARRILDDLDRMLAQYIRAQLLLSLAAMVAYTVFLLAMRFPYALVIGVSAGLLEFIPFVGPAITAVVIAAVGFFSGYPHWLLVLAFVGLWRVIQDYVNSPYLLGEGLELHPLAAIFGILVGGEVAGIPGMFLSVPIIATLRIVWHHWRLQGALRGGVDEAVPGAISRHDESSR